MSKKSFLTEQFPECKREGFVGYGPVRYFEPWEFPLFNRKAIKAFKKAIDETGKPPTTQDCTCLRFGGICHSGNIDCMRLRGFTAEEIAEKSESFKAGWNSADALIRRFEKGSQ